MENKNVAGLFDYIDGSPTPFHAVVKATEMLDKYGYEPLCETSEWNIQPNKKYYVVHNATSVFAFATGSGEIEKTGFRIIGAHGDAPGFRIKPNCDMLASKKYIKINTETYGGPIMSSWFDRPLGIAGRLCLKGETPFTPKEMLINLDRPVLVIPNAAIHVNRELNDGYKYNKQKDVLPLAGLVKEELEKDNYLLKVIAEEVGVNAEDIYDFDLAVYELTKSVVFGAKNEFISAPRMDDLWMCYAGLAGLCESADTQYFKSVLIMDNEETGSRSAAGADSMFLRDTLQRIAKCLNKSDEEFIIALRKSMVVSADLAHAEHPNYEDKADPTSKSALGGGPSIKFSSVTHNATTGYSSAVFAGVCDKAGIPYQFYACRSDAPAGGTIGPIVASRLSVNVVDVGAPLLGMHSCREVAAVCDNDSIIKAFTAFFEAD